MASSTLATAAGQYSNFKNFISGITEAIDVSTVYPAAGTQTATYNNLNQLTDLPGRALTFDADGNLTSVSIGMSAGDWQHVFATTGAIAVGLTALTRMALFIPLSAGRDPVGGTAHSAIGVRPHDLRG